MEQVNMLAETRRNVANEIPLLESMLDKSNMAAKVAEWGGPNFDTERSVWLHRAEVCEHVLTGARANLNLLDKAAEMTDTEEIATILLLTGLLVGIRRKAIMDLP